jgi:hypothetical protein
MGFLSKLVSYVTGTGPKGGKFYTNSHGNKEYGTPPKAAPAKPKAAKPVEKPPRGAAVAKTPDEKRAERAEKAAAKRARVAEGRTLRLAAEAAARRAIAAGVPVCAAHLASDQQKALMDAGLGPLLHKHPAKFIETPGDRGFYSTKESGGTVRFGRTPPDRRPYALNGTSEPTFAGAVRHNEHATLLHETAHHLHYKLAEQVQRATGVMLVSKQELAAMQSPLSQQDLSLHMMTGFMGGAGLGTHGYANHPGGALLRRIQDAHASDSEPVSHYARGNPAEWFAETHTAYAGDKAGFKKLRPDEYALIRDVRLHMGMPE